MLQLLGLASRQTRVSEVKTESAVVDDSTVCFSDSSVLLIPVASGGWTIVCVNAHVRAYCILRRNLNDRCEN